MSLWNTSTIAAAPLLLFSSGALATAVLGQTLRVEPTASQLEWTILHGDRKLLVYRADPRQFKPYVKELCTFRGDNLLRDAPHDHLHHHALMYAIKVNGLDFWGESGGSGVQKPVESRMPELGTSAAGHPQATIRQTLHWLATQDAFLPDSPKLALLVEQRTLVLTVDKSKDEVALCWTSQFEVGGKTNTVVLAGASYVGLGVRFLQELDLIAEYLNPNGKLDLTANKEDVSDHEWCAVVFDRPAAPATLAMFGHPANPGGHATFYTLKKRFAYLSATQALDKTPLSYNAGDKFRLRYLITVTRELQTPTQLAQRYQAWLKNSN